jgi:uncharacterized repeat protein (TIGR03803 family)
VFANLGRRGVRWFWLFGICVLGAALSPKESGAGQYREKLIHVFCQDGGAICHDGAFPHAGLLMDAAGNLYGTTAFGGTIRDAGLVFALTPDAGGARWAETVLYRFCAERNCTDGAVPKAPLVMDGAGNLYGTASDVVFELTPDPSGTLWTETVLYRFCAMPLCADGLRPVGGLVIDGAGNLYGMTRSGGKNFGGTVFALAPNATGWTETVLYSFCPQGGGICADGDAPEGGLVMDGAGKLYGTTAFGGGLNHEGVVFELTPGPNGSEWTETILHSFCDSFRHCADGRLPVAGLVMDGAGKLYGTTKFGGKNDDGTVFEVTPNASRAVWTETVLYSFCAQPLCIDGKEPLARLSMNGAGSLFGTAESVIFKLTPDRRQASGWAETVLYDLGTARDADGVIVDEWGNLYGTTNNGGIGGGTVFELLKLP